MRVILTFHLLMLSSLAFGSALQSLDVSPPVIEQNLVVMSSSAVLKTDRLAELGKLAVIEKSAASRYGASASANQGLLVVRNPMTGEYGTSDGGVIVRVQDRDQLKDVARDYGLIVKHVFSAAPMGILMSINRTAVMSHLEMLNEDPRVLFAELNVNFYNQKAN